MFNNLNGFVMSKITDETTRMQFSDKKFSHRRTGDAQLVKSKQITILQKKAIYLACCSALQQSENFLKVGT